MVIQITCHKLNPSVTSYSDWVPTGQGLSWLSLLKCQPRQVAMLSYLLSSAEHQSHGRWEASVITAVPATGPLSINLYTSNSKPNIISLSTEGHRGHSSGSETKGSVALKTNLLYRVPSTNLGMLQNIQCVLLVIGWLGSLSVWGAE